MNKSQLIFGISAGMDISLNMLKKAKRITNNLIQGNAFKIPLKSESLDLVFSIALLHHIYDIEGFFSSVYRTLKPEGIYYSDYDQNRRFFKTIRKTPFLSICLWLYKKISDQFIFQKGERKKWKAIHDVAEYQEELHNGLDPEEISVIAKKVGFSNVKWICHCDVPDLDFPRKGRWIHNILDLLLVVFSKDFNDRAKIFSIIAIK